MKLPDIISKFLTKPMELKNDMLPQHYPKSSEFEKFQVGYKVNGITGVLLTGNRPGDFKPEWYVLCSNYFDDPFIVDFTEETAGFPVYFSNHGAGIWVIVNVAETLEEFSLHLTNIIALQNDKDAMLNYLDMHVDLANEFWKDVHAIELEEEDLTIAADQDAAETQEWTAGKIVITNLGKDKMKIIALLKTKLKLSPQEALIISKQEEIVYQAGYLHLLTPVIAYLKSLGAEAVFRPDEM